MELVPICYELTRTFPDDQRFGLASQIQRASVSVPANIAEGSARGSRAETRRFYVISTASLMELDTVLILSQQLGFASQDRVTKVRNQIVQVLNFSTD
jgi:four helix bundle protein